MPVLLIIVFITAAGNEIMNSPALNLLHQTPQSLPNDLADSYLKRTNIQVYGKVGRIKYKIMGDKVVHYPGQKETEIFAPTIIILQEIGNPWEVRAKNGWVTPDGDKVRLEGKVVVSRQTSIYNKFSQLESEQLSIWPKQEYVESDEAVKIITKDMLITAIGLEADLYEQQYHLLSQTKVIQLKDQVHD